MCELAETSGAQSSQLPSPTTSIKLSFSSQTSASQNTNSFISTFSTSLNHKQVSEIISSFSAPNMEITAMWPSFFYQQNLQFLPISTINNKLYSSSQTSVSRTINNNMMTDPTSQNIKPDTELLATIKVSSSSDLKLNIFIALVLVVYVVVMIQAIIAGMPYLKSFFQKKSQKLSNITLPENENIQWIKLRKRICKKFFFHFNSILVQTVDYL